MPDHDKTIAAKERKFAQLIQRDTELVCKFSQIAIQAAHDWQSLLTRNDSVDKQGEVTQDQRQTRIHKTKVLRAAAKYIMLYTAADNHAIELSELVDRSLDYRATICENNDDSTEEDVHENEVGEDHKTTLVNLVDSVQDISLSASIETEVEGGKRTAEQEGIDHAKNDPTEDPYLEDLLLDIEKRLCQPWFSASNVTLLDETQEAEPDVTQEAEQAEEGEEAESESQDVAKEENSVEEDDVKGSQDV